MKLYSKQLHSLEELRREKHVLKYAAKHSGDLFSLKELGKDEEVSDAAGAGILGTVLSAMGSKSLFSTLLAIAPPMLTLLSRNSGSGKKKKNPLESIAKEVIFGYLKWKAIQIAYRGIMLLTGSKKHDTDKED